MVLHRTASNRELAVDGFASIDDNRRLPNGVSVAYESRKMQNDVSRAEYWMAFILNRCQFPNPIALAAQFANAEIVELCECGCNSFGLSMTAPESVPKLSAEGPGNRLVFEADFRARDELGESRSLQILLFADESGHLSYVEIDYCVNAFPMPDHLNLDESPYRVFASDSLISQSGQSGQSGP